MLALDTSSSMEGRPLRDLQDASRAAIEALQPGDRAAILSFGEAIEPLAPWGADQAALGSAVSQLRAGGATSLFDATLAALIARDHESGRRHLVVLFTDGTDTSSWLPDYAALDLALRTEVVVYCVSTAAQRMPSVGALYRRSGIRLAVRQPVVSSIDFLQELAVRTGGESLTASTGGLRRTFERIVTDFRSRYVLAYTPRGVAASGWHPIDVRVKGRSVKVTARRGYERGPR
jgi:Ca-activated chloride channel family protein